MKKPIFIIYFSFVTMLLISFSFSVLYYKKLNYSIYDKYLPKERIYPQYSLATQEVTNQDEVTVWKDSDFVPWYGIASYKIAHFIKWLSGVFFILTVLFYISVLSYNLLFNWKSKAILYWVIVTLELTICWYLMGCLPPP
jgi:hypothetical protein